MLADEDLSDWDAFMTPVDYLELLPQLPESVPAGATWSWQCPVAGCQRMYRRKRDLHIHAHMKHPDLGELQRALANPKSTREGKAFLCPHPTCRCGFATQKNLRRHLRHKHGPERKAGVLAVGALMFGQN